MWILIPTKDCEPCPCSVELEGSNSDCNDGAELFATLNSTVMHKRSSAKIWRQVISTLLRSGMTLQLSENPKLKRSDQSNVSPEDFRANRTAQATQQEKPERACSSKCYDLFKELDPDLSLQRTYQKKRLAQPQNVLRRLATIPKWQRYQRTTWVATTYGGDIGYLHTPNTKGNFCAPSMVKKWASCRLWVKIFGKVTPQSYEYLMAYPGGWTALDAWAMPSYPSARKKRLNC